MAIFNSIKRQLWRKFLLILFFSLLVLPGAVWAQDDFEPGLPAWQQPIVRPTYDSDPGRFIFGDVPFTYVALPGQPGDTVLFDIVVDTGPQDRANQADDGQLFLSVVCDGCKDIRYTAGDDGYVSDEEQWGHGWWGQYCRRCGWSATVTQANPTFRLTAVYYRRLQLRTHIEWTGTINRPSPVLVDQFTKDLNGYLAEAANYAGAAGETGGSALIAKGWPLTGGIVYALGWWSKEKGKPYFQKIHDDGWDDQYGTPYEAFVDPQLEADLAWVCEQEDDSGGFLSDYCASIIEALLQSDAYVRSVPISLDRAQSCLQIGAGCEGWQRQRAIDFFHQAAPYLGWLSDLINAVAQNMADRSVNADPTDVVGTLFWFRDVLSSANQAYQGVQ